MQLYYNPEPSPACMSTYNISSMRTPLLSDQHMTTCLQIFSDPDQTHFRAKVLPQQYHLRRRLFKLLVAGKGLHCSPLDGVLVSLHSSYKNTEKLNHGVLCVMEKASIQDDLTVCEAQCRHSGIWDYVLVDIWRYNRNVNTTLCEIMFSIWQNIFVLSLFHGYWHYITYIVMNHYNEELIIYRNTLSQHISHNWFRWWFVACHLN